ncbi:MAG: hypothetical protein A4E55_00317 [Pelotomaculum sp. PtaU1.Bin035]|nr:MAG: hypothetical protein A4E55_00317 [Pelotomaculum sp. PtaU1.Bin035]
MSEKTPRILKARACYGHLGGTLGGRLFERLLEKGWFEQDGDKTTVYLLTERGKQVFLKLGVDIYERR